MISVKNSFEIAYNGTENECRFELYADSAADLQGVTHYDGIKIQMGSECTDISTGDKYILNGSGVWVLQPSDRAFSNVYTKSDIDDMITEINGIIAYYHTTLISDTGEIAFYSLGGNVGTWKIYGNGQQNGTPTPDNPVMPEFVGTLDDSDWTIPITCAGQTTPVYLGEVPTVRRVKKLVLTGTRVDGNTNITSQGIIYVTPTETLENVGAAYCTHFKYVNQGQGSSMPSNSFTTSGGAGTSLWFKTDYATVANFQAYLASEYAAGHPVTIWYVLANEQTGIVNEPLAKIGDYADELHSTDAAVTIPTTRGQNTLTVDTTPKPSRIEIQGGITNE